MARRIAGVIIGVLVAFATIFCAEWIGHQVFPPPSWIDPTDPDSIATAIQTLPLGAKLAVVIAWFVGALAGGFVAARIARVRWAAWAVAALVLLATIANFAMIPHPVWMIAAGVGAPLFGGWLAARSGIIGG